MVKYQFTSQDDEKQINQISKLQEIIEQQADTIKKLKKQNDVLRIQLQELSLQQDKTQSKQQSNMDLLEIKQENKNKGCSILPFTQNVQKKFQSQLSLFASIVSDPSEQNIFQQNNNSLFAGSSLFGFNLQQQSNQVESKKVSQQNNIFQMDTNNKPQQLLSIFDSKHNDSPSIEKTQEINNIQNNTIQIQEINNKSSQQQKKEDVSNRSSEESFNIFENLTQKNNIFVKPNSQIFSEQVNLLQLDKQQLDNHVQNENENKNQQIIFQEDHEQESLLFGDPTNSFSNGQMSQIKAQDKVQQLSQDEQISNNQDLNQSENSKEYSSLNSRSRKASSNEKQEEFQIIQNDEDSNSI